MPHPYQCLLYCARPGQAEGGTLVAASGPYIHTFNVYPGTYLSSWRSNQDLKSLSQKEGNEIIAGRGKDPENSEWPQKRQKLSPPRDDSGSSAEIVINGGDAGTRKPKIKPATIPSVIKLAGTSSGRHVVAVTGEDKCIRVFELSEDGSLTPLSERVMPKRPCTVVLTPDESTILCADKFGDVYSLPLMGQTYESIACSPEDKQGPGNGSNERPQKAFVPSAGSLTVHTKGNLEALRQQQKIKNPKAEKKSLKFDHQLLLGHVSLLTDVACVSISTSTNKTRNYILSSDRDEHIRVSRGIPQAHVIEGYCLGHTEFVSKLCIVPTHPHLLISGGGDGFLILWDWRLRQIRQKIDLRRPIETLKRQHGVPQVCHKMTVQDVGSDTEEKIAVSNIRIRQRYSSRANELESEIIATCEGIPAFFILRVDAEAEIMEIMASSGLLEGNVIDLVVIQDQDVVVLSMDTVHELFSTTTVASDHAQKGRPSVRVMKIKQNNLGETFLRQYPEIQRPQLVPVMQQCIERQSVVHQNSTAKGKSLKDLLYGLESLRKRAGEEQNDRDE